MSNDSPFTSPSSQRVNMVRREPALPLNVAAAVAGRVRWLRHELTDIDRELGLTYPPINVVPAAWLNILEDGDVGVVPGRVNIAARPDLNVLVVELSAPALLEYDDDLIRGILAHEFLHVVHTTIAVWRRSESGEEKRSHVISEYAPAQMCQAMSVNG